MTHRSLIFLSGPPLAFVVPTFTHFDPNQANKVPKGVTTWHECALGANRQGLAARHTRCSVLHWPCKRILLARIYYWCKTLVQFIWNLQGWGGRGGLVPPYPWSCLPLVIIFWIPSQSSIFLHNSFSMWFRSLCHELNFMWQGLPPVSRMARLLCYFHTWNLNSITTSHSLHHQ